MACAIATGLNPIDMTCIVGYIDKKESKVYIGADSAGVAGMNVVVRKDVKVFKVADFIIGCTSSFRMIQLLRFSFNPPKKYDEEDLYKYMCTSFINEIRKCFREGGFSELDKNVESGGTFLVGYKDRLFWIGNDYQVGESEKDYDACGCGEPFALAALDALVGSEIDIKEKILTALNIAAYRSAGVRPPFLIEST